MVEHRRTPRAQVELLCTLRRRRGSPITARTRDIGPGGMCISAPRPLAVDELISFDVPLERGEPIRGRARVLRQQSFAVYALRFEDLSADDRARLSDFAQARLDAPRAG